VTEEVEAFLKCGILAHGFLRVVCDGCQENRLVAFSCQRRGFCNSCLGRRMCDFAAHLRDHVMPRVPVRQWVLTVPHGLRFHMAFNLEVTGLVLRTFVSVVSRWLSRRARAVGIRGLLKTGGVTVIQRFGSALNLNVDFHTLMIDGVYELRLGGPSIFHPVPAPTDDEVAAIAGVVLRKVGEKVARLGDVVEDAAAAGEPPLAGLASASVAGIVATAPGGVHASAASLGQFGRARRRSWAAAARWSMGSASTPTSASRRTIAKGWSMWRAIWRDRRSRRVS
jgi:hypothetical protein